MEIGFMGIGLMGLPMAERVLAAGQSLMVYNRSPEKVAPLRDLGAAIANDPATLIARSQCIILMLTNAQAIRELLFAEASLAQLAGKTVIQMGTIAPSESKAIGDNVVTAGGEYLEAPVLGSIPEAKAGTLIVMVGATPAQFAQWQAVLSYFGPEPRLIGPVGAAAAIKLALNQLIGSLTSAFATSLGFVQRNGVDVSQFMEILRGSALYAPTFDKKLQRMCDRNYANPNFPTKHMLKDTDLFLQEANSLGLDTHIPEGVSQILQRAIVQGLADADYSALFAAVNPDFDQL